MKQDKRYYLVSVDRTTVYRVKAISSEAAIMVFCETLEAPEVDSETTDMRSELDDDQEAQS
jgi:hypothetical protein